MQANKGQIASIADIEDTAEESREDTAQESKHCQILFLVGVQHVL